MFKYVSSSKKQLQRIILTQLACPQAVVILAIVAFVAAGLAATQAMMARITTA